MNRGNLYPVYKPSRDERSFRVFSYSQIRELDQALAIDLGIR